MVKIYRYAYNLLTIDKYMQSDLLNFDLSRQNIHTHKTMKVSSKPFYFIRKTVKYCLI